MPIYEYRCKNCQHKFDKLVPMSTEDAEIECPACHEKQAETSYVAVRNDGLREQITFGRFVCTGTRRWLTPLTKRQAASRVRKQLRVHAGTGDVNGFVEINCEKGLGSGSSRCNPITASAR